VILASGGFNRHPKLRAEMLPGIAEEWCPGAPGHTGSLHDLAKAIGAHYGANAMNHAYWAPVSIRKRADGSTAVWPHFVMDRSKPGMITVNKAGRRFVNETKSYHLMGIAMQEENKKTPAIPSYLIADADAMRKYGMGMVRPGGANLAPYLADGYVTKGETLAEVATKLGIDAGNLQATVARFNELAKYGVDSDFGRGVGAYSRNIGDAAWTGPNPCLGPLEKGPFYALKLYPGDIGAATGLATDSTARVLDATDAPIAGLYAVGNDQHSAMGGVYTAPGITIGPGIVFAYIAGRDAAARASNDLQAPASKPSAQTITA
jgi:succinate dehydrogenase/fumarate reductase flavoprotein subunit